MTLLPKIRRSPSALTGTLIILFLLLVALFAPWLAPYDRYCKTRHNACWHRMLNTGSERTATDVMCSPA